MIKPFGNHGKRNHGKIQGEGDYESAREYGREVRTFVASGKVKSAAARAAPDDAREAEAMRRAEEKGKSRAKDGKQPPGPGRSKPPKEAPAVTPPAKPVPEKLPGR